jgi:hypothetical protein
MKMTANPPPAQKQGWLPTGDLWRLRGANEKKLGEAGRIRIDFPVKKCQKAVFRQISKADRFAMAWDILELLSVFFFARQRSGQLFTADIV